MQSHVISTHHHGKPKSQSQWQQQWRKIAGVSGLYQYRPSGVFFANVRVSGKVYRESLETKDLALAKRQLAEFKMRLERTDPRFGKITFLRWLEDVYAPTLRGSPVTLREKRRVIVTVKTHWTIARTQPMRDLRESQVVTFLNDHYGHWSESYWNRALSVIRDALALAVRDQVLTTNPAGNLKYRKPKKPIRLTPSFEQFQTIVSDVRSQPFNADAKDSGDFLEAMGLLGLGQAELASMKREHVDLASGRILIFRQKTATPFAIPIYPQARALIERLCDKSDKPHQHLFAISQARKALTNACTRLGFTNYTQRSLRRMFITRCIEKGIDVKVIAGWQGHRDGGKLILDTYSHVRPAHEHQMAQRLTTELPENVLPMASAGQLC